jgi:glycosyltransferase involved in cell wall biosynthesis
VTDFEEVVRRADVYLIDNSSTMFEAAAAGLPIVALEPSYYRRSVDHGLRFWDAAGVGIPVRSRGSYDTSLSKKLNAAIEEALADPPERKAAREAALDIVYAHRTGAAARAAEAIGTWAAEPMKAVA